jgi:hypothetical protein
LQAPALAELPAVTIRDDVQRLGPGCELLDDARTDERIIVGHAFANGRELGLRAGLGEAAVDHADRSDFVGDRVALAIAVAVAVPVPVSVSVSVTVASRLRRGLRLGVRDVIPGGGAGEREEDRERRESTQHGA